MTITHVGPISCAKIAGMLYAIIGFVFGACLSVAGLVAGGLVSDRTGGAALGAMFGVGAIVLLPIVYGVFGFLGTLIGAWLYNVAAGMVGGVEIDVR